MKERLKLNESEVEFERNNLRKGIIIIISKYHFIFSFSLCFSRWQRQWLTNDSRPRIQWSHFFDGLNAIWLQENQVLKQYQVVDVENIQSHNHSKVLLQLSHYLLDFKFRNSWCRQTNLFLRRKTTEANYLPLTRLDTE